MRRMLDLIKEFTENGRLHRFRPLKLMLREGEIDHNLIEHILFGNIDEVKKLLAEGADPDSCNDNNTPAIMIAVHEGFPEIVEMLLKAGANPNAFSPISGRTALHMAAELQDSALVKTLLEAGAYPNMLSKHRGSPLNCVLERSLYGSYNENSVKEAAEILLKYGASMHQTNDMGKDIFSRAREEGWNNFIQFLENYEYPPEAINTLKAFHAKYHPNNRASTLDFPNLTDKIQATPHLSDVKIKRNEVADLIIKHCINSEYESAYNLWTSGVNRYAAYYIERIVDTKIEKLPQETINRIKSAFKSIIEQDKQLDTTLSTHEQFETVLPPPPPTSAQLAKEDRQKTLERRAKLLIENKPIYVTLSHDPNIEEAVSRIRQILDDEFKNHTNLDKAKSDLDDAANIVREKKVAEALINNKTEDVVIILGNITKPMPDAVSSVGEILTTKLKKHPNLDKAKSDLDEIANIVSEKKVAEALINNKTENADIILDNTTKPMPDGVSDINQTLDIDSFTSVAQLIAQDLIKGDLKRVYDRLSNNPNRDAIILCTEDILSHTDKYRNDAGAQNAKFALNEISRFVSSGLPFDPNYFSSLSATTPSFCIVS